MYRLFIIASALWLAGAPVALASFFRLNLNTGSRVLAGRVAVRATMTNRGDEVMRSLQTRVWFNHNWTQGPQYPELGIGESLKDELDVGPLPERPGTYTAVVTTRYTDRNGHPFTTAATIPVHTVEPSDEHPFDAKLAPLTLEESGALRLTLTSQTNTPLTVNVHLVVPEELEGQPTPDVALQLAAGENLTREFPLRNAWAVPGSQYRIFAIVDYVVDDRHGSRVVPGSVTRTPRRALSATDIRRLWIVPGALLVLFGLAQFRKPRSPMLPG